VKLLVADGIEPARLDGELFADALTEILVNALESGPKGCVEIQAFVDTGEDRLMIQISDDGRGMSEHALAHATDPFFSEKPAGRQSGLGLALAHRLLQSQGAVLGIQSRPGRGTAVTVSLTRWRWSSHQSSDR
jgi:signal transduction histidine kinase